MGRALDAPPAHVRLFFLYGPDDAGAAAHAQRLASAMGPGAERVDLEGSTLKADPARLSDEAASFSMFGDKRWVRVTGCGDESVPAIEALLGAEQAGNPVIALGGDLKKTSRLVKLALDHPAVLALACYLPDQREASQIVTQIARARGLNLSPDLARTLVAMTGGDQALMTGEVEKVALYLDADPARPVDATAEAIAALSAELADADPGPLVNAVMGGRVDAALHELTMLDARGAGLAGVMRPMLGRAIMIAAIRAELDRSGRMDTAMDRAGKAVFWKEKPAVEAQVKRWSAPDIASAVERLAQAERTTRDSRSAGEIVVRHELLTIARQAARAR